MAEKFAGRIRSTVKIWARIAIFGIQWCFDPLLEVAAVQCRAITSNGGFKAGPGRRSGEFFGVHFSAEGTGFHANAPGDDLSYYPKERRRCFPRICFSEKERARSASSSPRKRRSYRNFFRKLYKRVFLCCRKCMRRMQITRDLRAQNEEPSWRLEG